MKKKILGLGVITILIVMLILLTGCGNNNEGSNENKTNQSVDKTEEVIYKFEKYIQNENAKELATIFESDSINNISEKFTKLFEDGFSYDITNVYKVESDETFYEHFDPDQAKSLTTSINKRKEKYGENTTVYIVEGKQKVGDSETSDFTDFFFIVNESGNYKIVSTILWDWTFYERPQQ